MSTATLTPPSCSRIDFSSTPLGENYSGFFATVLDDVFSEEECADLLKLAKTPPNKWEPIAVAGDEVHASNFRHSDRSLVFGADEAALKIYERLRPFLPEIHEISPLGEWSLITGKAGRTKQAATWKLVGCVPISFLRCGIMNLAYSVNSRLSFLRYGPGHYFKPHCDGLNTVGEHKSFVTLQIYLNDRDGNGTKLQGGATRFWTPNKKRYIDVEPKIGRVLVFQQRMLIHSGEEVVAGMKYTMRSDFMFEEVKK